MTTTTTSPPSKETTMTETGRLSAAADLIRNLDAALSQMNQAASTAARDAARARRNAKAAGEVARRYGGGGLSSSLNIHTGEGGVNTRNKNHKRKSPRYAGTSSMAGYSGSGGTPKSSNSHTNTNGGGSASTSSREDRLRDAEQRALERKWERRTAARLAAEARQRRESPRKELGGGSMAGFRAVVKDTVEMSRGYVPSPRAMTLGGASAAVAVGGAGLSSERLGFEGDSAPFVSETTSNGNAVQAGQESNANNYDEASDIPIMNNEHSQPIDIQNDDRTADGTDLSYVTMDTFTGFEDALEDHTHDGHSLDHPPRDNDGEGGEHGNAAVENQQQTSTNQNWQQWKQHTADQVGQEEYYNQQQQYYDQQQQNDQNQQEQQQQEGYYNQNQQNYYNQEQQNQQQYDQAWESSIHQQQQHQQQPTPTIPTSIEASHAEDVLALSLQLERTKSQLAQTTSTLQSTQCELTSLQSSNTHLQSENTRLSQELSTLSENTSNQVREMTQKYQQEMVRAKAAEEDAALALDLAKEAQTAKEEVETWLGRSLEEIEVWKRRVAELEGLLKQQDNSSGVSGGNGSQQDEGGIQQEPKKFVRFADQNQMPASPLVHPTSAEGNNSSSPLKQHPIPPPPPAPSTPTSLSSVAPLPSTAANATNMATQTNKTEDANPSKSAIASGRAWLHRNSPNASAQQASDLLKRSAETRKLLRERLGTNGTSSIVSAGAGAVGGNRWSSPNTTGGPTPPPSMALIAATAANAKSGTAIGGGGVGSGGDGSILSTLNDSNFANRQGAACRAVGRTIRESGQRLELEGKWWSHTKRALTDGSEGYEPVIQGVAELESMVRDYCGTVEGTIGKQKEKIGELEAFCDHLEKEVVNGRMSHESGGERIGSTIAVAGTF